MKKIFLIAVFLLFGTFMTFAQMPNFNLGIKAGVNMAKLNTDFANEENRLGYQVGAWARIGAVGFYVQPEAYLGGKNNKFSFTSNNNNVEGEARFTTLDIPLLLGSKIGTNKLNVRFMAGPVVSFLLDENTTFKSAFTEATDFQNYKNQAWGAQGGAGVDLGNLTIDLRYEAGISNLNQTDKYEQKQNLWHLSLGYKLF